MGKKDLVRIAYWCMDRSGAYLSYKAKRVVVRFMSESRVDWRPETIPAFYRIIGQKIRKIKRK